MISIDDQHPPPDPSSSDNHNQQQQQVSHEAFPSVSDIDLLKLKPTDANLDDTNNPLPKFSIRGYVFESRYKDIARNWPFSDKSLRHCLNYGVKNLLPPFQTLDSVRNYSSVSVCAVENCSPDEETISNIDSIRNDRSQCHLEEDLTPTKSSSQPIVKKCKLVMKLNLGVEQIEETAASKICPVCKTFSSSSNTTLNAHIDSCLSEESTMKWNANLELKTVKHRIKPRKTRLMVDVYKTAPRCTIEELDRRNGTNWATNSSFPDQELKFQAEEKKKDPQEPTFIIPEVADHEGAVYIDKNGKKVRILSMPKFSNLDDVEACVLEKGRKGSKPVIKKKKRKVYMQKNDRNFLKLSPNRERLSKNTESGQKETAAIVESCEKEDGGAKCVKALVNKQMDDLVITRPPWACAKRTGVAEKRFPVTKRKEGTLLDDSCENHMRTRGSKFSSLKKSLSMPASREHNARSKLVNLKRKFSSLPKSQESLKQKSRTEKDTRKKMSFETVDVLEVKTKTSFTYKSSNDDSSSRGLEITSESAGTEECIRIEPGFMDNEFSKMTSQLDHKFDSQQHTLDEIIMEHNTEKQGNYFDEVDPIPIPGPPGSFLPPSPGADMGSEEEPQGNSSLTTMSRVQSSEDHRHHDIMNQDFISGSSISTVSSPSFTKSADKLSVRFDKVSVNNNSTDLRSVDAVFKEKGLIPCCCSRREGAFFKNLSSYPQESAVSKEQASESNRLTSELFPLANHLTLPPPEMVKSPAVSPTTPVLRLMGKNLTVVNTDNQQVKPPPSSPAGQFQQLQKFQNENHDSLFYGHPPQNDHIIFSHHQNGSMNQCFNLYPPKNSITRSDLVSANMDNNATKEIIVIDDSSENEGDDHPHPHHMFKEPMKRNLAFGFANPYGSGSFQTSSPLREVANDGNHGRWVPTAYYPRSFLDQQVKEKVDRV